MSSQQPQMSYICSGKVYAIDPELAPLRPRPEPQRRRSSCMGSFVKLAVLGLAIWVIIEYVHPALRSFFHGPSHHWSGDDNSKYDTRMVLPSDVEVKDCADWTSITKTSRKTVAITSLDLPVDSERIFFLRDGIPIGGNFEVVQGNSISDNIHVDVVLSTKDDQFIEETKVCYLGRETGGDGVGILADFTPHRSHGETTISVIVRLPLSRSGDGKLALKTFESNLPFIRQILLLNDAVTFGRLHIQSEFASIATKDVFATKADLETTYSAISGIVNASESLSLSTSNAAISGDFTSENSIIAYTSSGRISGRFKSSNSIILSTSNARIDAAVELFNDGTTGKSTILEMETSNGAIDGTISTTSLAPNNLGGQFTITSQTNNARNSLKLPVISPQAQVDVSATTSLGAVSVEVNEAWEGEYQVQVGMWDTADISARGTSQVDDPEGRGRQRHIEGTGTRGSFNGRVWWGDEGSAKGSIRMSTSFARARLAL